MEPNTPESEKGWQPDKDFYLSDPRAEEIRAISLQILNCMDNLLYDPEVANDKSKQDENYARIKKARKRLEDLGVEPKMHVGKKLEDFQKSPVTSSEFVAGNVLNALDRQPVLVSESQAVPLAQEFAEAKVGGGYKFKIAGAPRRLIDHNIMRSITRHSYDMLGAEPAERTEFSRPTE